MTFFRHCTRPDAPGTILAVPPARTSLSGASKKLTRPFHGAGRIVRVSRSTQHHGPTANGSPATSASGTQSASSTTPTSAP